MKKTIGLYMVGLLAGFASAAVVSHTFNASVLAQDNEQTQTEDAQDPQDQSDDQNNEHSNTYTYVAQPGDSYTQMARKAVQTYGIVNEVELSPAGIIFAETNLTQDAGSPLLDIGQQVEINESSVETWLERAQELTEEEEADWEYYVQFVDFNTDNVGEAR